jgi:gliding motility-associated-like protein
MLPKPILFIICFAMQFQVLFAQPGNDNCIAAQNLCPNTPVNGTNVSATSECNIVGDCTNGTSWGRCFSVEKSVWYKFKTNSKGGNAAIKISNISCLSGDSLQAVVISAGVPCDSSTYTLISCNAGGKNEININLSALTPASTYYVEVDGINSECNFSILLSGEAANWETNKTQNNLVCASDCNGSASFNIVTGYPPHSYLWSNSSTDTSQTNLCSGSYSVTISGNNACDTSLNYILTSPSPLSATSTKNDISCAGKNDGSASVSVSGGTPPYIYSWSEGSSTSSLSNLPAGSYSVNITDNNNCDTTIAFFISEPSELSTSINTVNSNCGGSNSGSATVTATGGSTPYTYSWTTPANTNTSSMTGIPPGNYSVIVSYGQNCSSDTIFFDITEPEPLVISVSSTSAVCGSDANIGISASGGMSPYSYLWDDGNKSSARTKLSSGSYSVTITDKNNCTKSETVVIAEEQCPFNLIPNKAFSPNEDGINDVWNIENAIYFTNLDVNIYNRWGQLVHRQTGYTNPWDGKDVLGISVPDGVYYYVIFEEKGKKNSQEMHGSVAVVR